MGPLTQALLVALNGNRAGDVDDPVAVHAGQAAHVEFNASRDCSDSVHRAICFGRLAGLMVVIGCWAGGFGLIVANSGRMKSCSSY